MPSVEVRDPEIPKRNGRRQATPLTLWKQFMNGRSEQRAVKGATAQRFGRSYEEGSSAVSRDSDWQVKKVGSFAMLASTACVDELAVALES